VQQPMDKQKRSGRQMLVLGLNWHSSSEMCELEKSGWSKFFPVSEWSGLGHGNLEGEG
jgi:hypothetical protein